MLVAGIYGATRERGKVAALRGGLGAPALALASSMASVGKRGNKHPTETVRERARPYVSRTKCKLKEPVAAVVGYCSLLGAYGRVSCMHISIRYKNSSLYRQHVDDDDDYKAANDHDNCCQTIMIIIVAITIVITASIKAIITTGDLRHVSVSLVILS